MRTILAVAVFSLVASFSASVGYAKLDAGPFPDVSSPSIASSVSSDTDAFMKKAEAVAQDPGGYHESDKRCERPAPGGDPNVGGTDKNKIGCGCVRECKDGKPVENTDPDKKCKSYCHPDHCDCPNPCVS